MLLSACAQNATQTDTAHVRLQRQRKVIYARDMDGLIPLRVFISSPSDVRIERGKALALVQRLAREFAQHAKIEPVFWEHEPVTADQHWQDGIPDPRATDIVIVIIWSRLGLRLPVEKYLGQLTHKPVTGTEWEFEAALAGKRERAMPELLVYRKTAKVIASVDDEQDFATRRDQLREVDDFFTRWFGNATQATGAVWPFASPEQLEEQLYMHLRKLVERRVQDTLRTGSTAPVMSWFEGSPFRGLASYSLEHAQIFFGRSSASGEVRDRVLARVAQQAGFVLVLGASGSGKSSLVQAGVLPQLLDAGVFPGTGAVRHVVMTPGTENAPTTRLARALLTALPEIDTDADQLRKVILQGGEGLTLALQRAQREAAKRENVREGFTCGVIIIVDQLEELLTAAPAERLACAVALASLASMRGCCILCTMRSDAMQRMNELGQLALLSKGDALCWVQAPTEPEVGQMIEQPALQAGLRFATRDRDGASLADVLRADAAQQPGSLPLLSFVLDQLYQQRADGGMLTFNAYEACGGLVGAIASTAEQVMSDASPQARAALPKLLRLLAHVDEHAPQGAGVRAQWVPVDRIRAIAGGEELVTRLTAPDARLLVMDSDTQGGGQQASENLSINHQRIQRVRVAHEALLTQWPLAKDQLARDASTLATRQRVEASAERYAARMKQGDAMGAQSLLLAEGLPLSEGEELVGSYGEEVSERARAFVNASRKTVDLHREERLRKVKRVAVGFGVLAMLALVAGGVAWWQRGRAERFAQQTKALNDYLQEDVFGLADIDAHGGATTDVKELLRASSNRIESAFPGDIAQQTRTRVSIGGLLVKLGELDRSVEVLQQARAQALALNDASLLAAIDGNIAEATYRREIGANMVAELVKRVDSARASLGKDRTGQLEFASLLNHLGGAHKHAGSLDESEKAYSEALSLRKTALQPDDVDTLITEHNINQLFVLRARAAGRVKDFARAAALLTEGIAARTSLTARTLAALGPLNGQSLASRAEELGMEGQLAALPEPYGDQAKLSELLNEYPVLLADLRQGLGPMHWRTLETLGRYGRELRSVNRHAEAMQPLLEALHGYRNMDGPIGGRPVTLAKWAADSYEKAGGVALAAQLLASVARDAEGERTAVIEGEAESVHDERVQQAVNVRSEFASLLKKLTEDNKRPDLLPTEINVWAAQ